MASVSPNSEHPPDLSRISTRQDSRPPSPSPRTRQTSIQFDERSSTSYPRSRRSIDVGPMPSNGHITGRQMRSHIHDSEDPDSEIRPIATSGDRRNYSTASTTGQMLDSHPTQSDSTPKPRAQSPPSESNENPPWYRRLAEKYGSVELENKGSVARDHLALERTFLAWLRTSLAFASIGIAITQLFRLNTAISPGNESSRRLEYSPYIGHTIPIPSDPSSSSSTEDTPYIPPDQSLLALLTSPHPNAIPSDTAAHLRHLGKPLGATFLAVAVLVLLNGFHRYFESQHWIIRGKFPASRASVAIVGFLTGALIVTCLVVVLAVGGSALEK